MSASPDMTDGAGKLTLAEVAEFGYEAYRSRLLSTMPNPSPMPPWRELSAKKRAAWTFAARMIWNVIDDTSNNIQETGT